MRFSLTDEKEVKKFFVIFYTIGTLGMIIPQTFMLFCRLTPFSLLLSIFYLAWFHPDKKELKGLIAFTLIFVTGLVIEIIGVNTGKIFGSYEYSNKLGIKIFGTPLLIGLNWVMLTYLSSSVVEKMKLTATGKICLASLIMLVYDIILEQAAPIIGLWEWEGGKIPLQNYAIWLLLAVMFNSLVKIFRIKTTNPLSAVILYSQLLFFIVVLIFHR